MSDKNKLYYENNKHKYSETVICEGCGVEYRRYTKGAHEKTKKHITRVTELELAKLKSIDNMEKKEVFEQMEKKEKNIMEVLDKIRLQLNTKI